MTGAVVVHAAQQQHFVVFAVAVAGLRVHVGQGFAVLRQANAGQLAQGLAAFALGPARGTRRAMLQLMQPARHGTFFFTAGVGGFNQRANIAGQSDVLQCLPHLQAAAQHVGRINKRTRTKGLQGLGHGGFQRRGQQPRATRCRAGARGLKVPPQPPQALQQHVGGCKGGDEKVGIDVQRLLQHLRAHQNAPLRGALRPAGFAKQVHPSVFNVLPIRGGKA